MTLIRHLLAPLLILGLTLAATDAHAGKLGRYSKKELKSAATAMADKLGIADAKLQQVFKRMDKALKGPLKGTRISGVFAYKVKEGGLLIKLKKGSGFISFKGGPQGLGLRLESTSFGAQAGGSSERGIGLVIDLGDDSKMGGTYDGKVRGATAGKSGMQITEIDKPDGDHRLYMIGSASGLSANVAKAKYTISVTR